MKLNQISTQGMIFFGTLHAPVWDDLVHNKYFLRTLLFYFLLFSDIAHPKKKQRNKQNNTEGEWHNAMWHDCVNHTDSNPGILYFNCFSSPQITRRSTSSTRRTTSCPLLSCGSNLYRHWRVQRDGRGFCCVFYDQRQRKWKSRCSRCRSTRVQKGRLEHKLVRRAGGQTVVGQIQQSGFQDREVAHACCSIRPCETSCTAVHSQW